MLRVCGRLPIWYLGASGLCAACSWGCNSDSGGGPQDAGLIGSGGSGAQLEPDASAAGDGGAPAAGNGGGGAGGESGSGGGGAGGGNSEADAAPPVTDAGVSPEGRACRALCARAAAYNNTAPCTGFTEALCFATCTSVTEFPPYLGCDAQHIPLLQCQTSADVWTCQASGAIDAGGANEIAPTAACPAEQAAFDSCNSP